MILKVHVHGAAPYNVGDEIWQEPLAGVIRAEADTIASYADAATLGDATRDALRDRVTCEMTTALVSAGDTYRAPDRVLYMLEDDDEPSAGERADTLTGMSSGLAHPVVDEVLRFETLPLDQGGTRRAIVRWSNGGEGIALVWYPDEILVCEGDHGNSRLMALGSRSFRRERHLGRVRGT
jgi:hypothetical protein